MVANSKLCGKCPSEKPLFAEQPFGVRAGDAGAQLGDAGHLVEG